MDDWGSELFVLGSFLIYQNRRRECGRQSGKLTCLPRKTFFFVFVFETGEEEDGAGLQLQGGRLALLNKLLSFAFVFCICLCIFFEQEKRVRKRVQDCSCRLACLA